MMTKKDYEKAAEIVRAVPELSYRIVAADCFTRLFKSDNPRFDVTRFQEACEPGIRTAKSSGRRIVKPFEGPDGRG